MERGGAGPSWCASPACGVAAQTCESCCGARKLGDAAGLSAWFRAQSEGGCTNGVVRRAMAITRLSGTLATELGKLATLQEWCAAHAPAPHECVL